MKKKQFMKIAKECIKESMKPLAFDANVSMKTSNASPLMQKRMERYLKLKEALEYLEHLEALDFDNEFLTSIEELNKLLEERKSSMET